MSTTFEKAIEHTLRFEGGYVNDPDDPGGATKYGISLRYLLARGEIEAFDYDGDGDVDADDVKRLTPADARLIYRERFWNESIAGIPSEMLAVKVFDFGVNMGPKQATRLLQRAVNDNSAQGSRLVVDGSFGPRTRSAVTEVDVARPWHLVYDLEHHAARFYYGLAEKRRSSRKYLFGWLRRCYDRPEL